MTRPTASRTSSEATPHSGVASFRWGDRTLTFRNSPLVMGILNTTPDSFHAASRVDSETIATAAAAMAEAGADILDLGAESSRPGAEPIGGDEELARLLPAITAVREVCDLPLSVDTCRASTAAAALDAGVDAVNDISAGQHDPGMFPLVARHNAGLILMHMPGRPSTMQDNPHYDDVVTEVADHLARRASEAESAGVEGDRILVDPGIGFGKTLDHNLALLTALDRLGDGRPLVLGASRKSFIDHLGRTSVADRLPGSLAAVAAAFQAGVAVVRVHDVAESVQFLRVLRAISPRRTIRD